MRIALIILLLCCANSTGAQKVRVQSTNKSFEKYRDSKYFDYVHEDHDTSAITWIADIRVHFDTVKPGMIGESFKLLKERSHRYGANGFRVKDSDIYTPGERKYIDLSVFWIRMEDRSKNLQLHRDNKVYLFGFLGYHQEIEGYDVKIQESEFIMRALTYREFDYKVKTEVTIQLGTKARGTKAYCTIRENMYPKFYYFNMLKGSFKNAWIDEYSLSYGIFLTKILQKD